MNKTANLITTEERIMLRDYLLLLQMHIMVQHDMAEVKLSGNLLRRAYGMCARAIEEKIIQDTKKLRITLKERGINVTKEEQNSDGFIIRYHYTCRGYNEHFAMIRDVMRSEIGVRFGNYISEIGAILKPKKGHN